MWRAEQGASAPNGGTPEPKSLATNGKATPEMPVHPGSLGVSQHPTANPTPFSSFPTAWAMGTAPASEYSNLHGRPSSNAHPPGSIVHPPSDLLPQGLLATPQPSTPATTLLKVLANRGRDLQGLTIAGPDTAYGGPNGTSADSPANSGDGAFPPLDSLVLPSPSLLPGGVHSLPTPTSSSSQPHRPHESYGSRCSPADTGSSKDSTASPVDGAKGPMAARTTASAGGKRLDGPPQQSSRNGSGGGSGGGGLAPQGRTVDGSSSSGGSAQMSGPPHFQQPVSGNHHGGYGNAGMQQGHSMHHAGALYIPQHHAHQSAGGGAGMAQGPGSPTVGYSGSPYYMAPMPPGMMVGMQNPGGSGGGATGGGNNRSSGGGNGGITAAMRDGNAGSGWRGSRSAGGSGAQGGGGGGNGNGQGGNHPLQYGMQQQQQRMQGSMVHDGGGGAYGIAHMHPGPYAVYSMMGPGIQVLSPVVGSPRGMESHGPLAHHHMGPMVVPHGASMAMGMGMGMGAVHSYPSHGPMGGPHMGLHPMAAHPHAGGGAHGVGGFAHPHSLSMGASNPGSHHGGPGSCGGYGQQQYGHLGGGMHSHVGSYGSGNRGGGVGKGPGGSAAAMQQQQQQAYGGAVQKNQLAARSTGGGGSDSAAGGAAATGANNSGRDSPLIARGRAGGRDKSEKSRSSEQRERKPGNSRAPAAVAQCASDVPALDEQLQNLVRQLTPGSDELAAHQSALTAVREMVAARWPQVKVHLFGSGANGLSIGGANEIDITLEVLDIAWDDHAAKAAMVSELGELASGGPAVAEPKAADAAAAAGEGTAAAEAAPEGAAESVATGAATPMAAASSETPAETRAGDSAGMTARIGPMTAVSALPKARTPVVKLTVTDTQTRVDITINNLLAISNTRLLGHYCDVDPRLRQMAVFVKHWAKTRGVNDAYRGSLSSYAYVLLCIWLLQQRQPPILPVLQQRQPHTYDTTVGPWRCSYNDQVQEVMDFGAGNKETLAELLVAFFDHWAWRHDYNGSVVCVRTGGTMAKSAKDWTKRQGNERHLMCIEDPFELCHDHGRTIDKAAVQVLRREFERAARIFASSLDPLSELLAPLTPEEEATIAAALQSRRKASKDKDKEKDKDKSSAAAAGAGSTGAVAAAGAQNGELAAGVPGDGDEGSQRVSELGLHLSRASEEQESDDEGWSGDGQTHGEVLQDAPARMQQREGEADVAGSGNAASVCGVDGTTGDDAVAVGGVDGEAAACCVEAPESISPA